MFYIRPGWVRSQNDGDEHWVGVGQLARLYHLHEGEYRALRPDEQAPRGVTVLGPRHDGRYERP